ncbi:MAG: hypothetical protein KKH85_05170 [Proteobacteria bacterium]|nr:hypothetical protein [Pseudomonadota bacterium]
MNARINKNLKLRAEIVKSIRLFFTGHNYLEVETPIRFTSCQNLSLTQ